MQTIILNNGITMLCHAMPNTHSITVGIYVKAGLAYGEPKNGIGHLMEHLHFRRLGELSQRELYYRMEKIGSTLRAETYRDFIKFSMKVVPEYLKDCAFIMKQVLDSYSWYQNEFDMEKQVVLNQIVERGNYITIEKESRKNIFRTHPLALEIMGSESSVSKITMEDVIEYKREIFNAQNLLICITGKINDSDIQMSREYFQSCSVHHEREKKFMRSPKWFYRRKPDIRFVYTDDDSLLEVDISFDLEWHEDIERAQFDILNCILGEGVGSRLQCCIREEKGYTADVVSFIEWYREFGVLHITFSVERERLLPCLEEICNVLQVMKSELNLRDLETTLPFYTTNQVFMEDDTEELNFYIGYNGFVLNNESAFSKSGLEHIGTSDMQKLAQKVFVSSNACITILGNLEQIKQSTIRTIFNF